MNCLRFGHLLNSDFGLKYLFFVGTRSRFYLMKIMTHSSRRSYVINLIILIALSVFQCFLQNIQLTFRLRFHGFPVEFNALKLGCNLLR